MREYTLINGIGEDYKLTEKKKAFLHSVSGLGYSEDMEFQSFDNRHKLLKNKKKQGEIDGTVKFWGRNALSEYRRFVRFVQCMPLTLVYLDQSVEYRRNCYVTSVERSESDTLQCNVKLTCITPWHRTIDVMTVAGVEAGGKSYNYKYDYTYKSTPNNSVIINSDTYIRSPAKLTIYGPMTNPSWTHYVNNIEVGRGKVYGTIPEGSRLVISTEVIPYTIKMYDSNDKLVADMYQGSDFSTERFIALEFGENKVVVGDDGSNVVNIKMEAMLEYASV